MPELQRLTGGAACLSVASAACLRTVLRLHRRSRYQEADMTDKTVEPAAKSEADRQDEYIRGGKGRKDEVGGSGIYPASAPDVPADAEIRSEAGFGHKGPEPNPPEEQP